MKSLRLLLVLLPLLLAACAPSPQELADYSAVQRSGVNPAIYDKMVNNDALSVYDIASLGRARVSDAVILRYLRNQQTTYYLNSNDVQALLHAGVSQSVVDYMLQTPSYYQSAAVYPVVDLGFGPYWGGPYGYYGGHGYYGGGGYYGHGPGGGPPPPPDGGGGHGAPPPPPSH